MNFLKNKSLKAALVILALSAAAYLPGLGAARLFDWDEVNFAEAAREMLITGEPLRVTIDFQPFWEKPPLFFWLQVLSMKVFGVNDFSARFPNALFGFLTLLTLYGLGTRFRDRRMGMFWAISYFGSLLPALYFRSGIIDPVFNYFIFLSVWFLADGVARGRWILIGAAGALSGLAVLTKGPVGYLLPVLAAGVVTLWTLRLKVRVISEFLLFSVVAGAVASIWFLAEWISNGPAVLVDFIQYQIRLFQTQDAGHGGPFYYHAVVLLLGCFPASLFFLWGSHRRSMTDTDQEYGTARWMLALFWVVLILFSYVKTKILHYSSLAYFPITFFSALAIARLWASPERWTTWRTVIVASIGVIWGAALIGLPLLMANPNWISGLMKDEFSRAILHADVPWRGEFLVGVVFLLILMGVLWTLRKDFRKSVVVLFLASGFSVSAVGMWTLPKIEAHVQGAPLDFYESLQGCECYVTTLGFKSYAHYYYTRRPSGLNPLSRNRDWLIAGEIDRPAFFVTKVGHADYYRQNPQLVELYSKNGFAFFRRDPLK